ncbi:MAG: TIM barrel protein [Planctomycetaceae bacterium]
MDVLLEPLPFVNSRNHSASDIRVSEALNATTLAELVGEVSELTRRGIAMVSIRRQQILRIGPAPLQHVLADSGLEVSSIGFAGGFTGTLGRGYKQAVDDTRRAIELAAEFRARSVIVVAGSRNLHTRRHAERIVRDGLNDCLDDALRLRVTMLVPMNSVFGHRREVYRPEHLAPLDWIDSLESLRIRSLLMLRGQSPWNHLPDCWRRCLTSGGYLRASPRCRAINGSQHLLSHIASRLEIASRKKEVKTRAG